MYLISIKKAGSGLVHRRKIHRHSPRFGMSIYKTRVVSVGMFCFSNHIIDFLFKLLHVMVG